MEMAGKLASAAEESSAARLPPYSRRPTSRTAAQRLTSFGIITVLHVLAALALWTRHRMIEAEPAPLLVTSLDTVVQAPPPPATIIAPLLAAPPVVLAAPLPPTIEIAEEAPTAIIAQALPAQPPAPVPAASNAVTEARFDAAYLNNPAPAYPPLARRLREEGVVVLKVLVRSDGSVADARVDQHSGSSRLDDAALAAVKRWHFVPARRGEQPIEAWVLVPIEFELQS